MAGAPGSCARGPQLLEDSQPPSRSTHTKMYGCVRKPGGGRPCRRRDGPATPSPLRLGKFSPLGDSHRPAPPGPPLAERAPRRSAPTTAPWGRGVVDPGRAGSCWFSPGAARGEKAGKRVSSSTSVSSLSRGVHVCLHSRFNGRFIRRRPLLLSLSLSLFQSVIRLEIALSG